MTSSRREAAIFDAGNVLIQNQMEGFYDAEIDWDHRPALFDTADLQGVNDQVYPGVYFTDTAYATTEANPGWWDNMRMWHMCQLELATAVIRQLVRLMRAFQSHTYAATYHSVLNEFDRGFTSGHMGMTKSHTIIYNLLESVSGFTGPRRAFTDRRPNNIEAAQQFGRHTHLFVDPKAWLDRLMEAGSLTQDRVQ